MNDSTTTRYYQQATTGVLHATKSCSITSRTRYDHFVVDFTADEAAKYAKCRKCFAVEQPAPNALDEIERTAKSLRVPMTHVARDPEYVHVLRYRIEQEIAAAEQRLDNLRDLLSDVDAFDPPALIVNDAPRVHVFDSSSEAYDVSQCNSAIRDGDVLVVPSERAIAVLVEAWPTAVEADMSGDAFHVLSENVVWSRVSGTRMTRDYTPSLVVAAPIAARMRTSDEIVDVEHEFDVYVDPRDALALYVGPRPDDMPPINADGCVDCMLDDDGDVEDGPHLLVFVNPTCPIHGSLVSQKGNA
jgi:hypothetical protein